MPDQNHRKRSAAAGDANTIGHAQAMPGGGGHATVYNRETGKFSGYGFDEDGQ